MQPSLAETFAGRSVFLTGHTGFKGSWLAIWLDRLGARVSGYALSPPTEPNNFLASNVGDLLAGNYVADVRNADSLTRAIADARPDAIFHLAAKALVQESYLQPRETFEVNIMGAVGVLDAVRSIGRPCAVVVVSSDKCYENREHVWGYREIDPMGGYDPYSASKGAVEIVTAAYRRSFFPPDRLAGHGIKVATARAGNVIGGGDWAKDRIIPDVVRHLQAGEAVPVRNPAAVRPWQHVLEPLSGYLTLAARMLGSDDPRWCDAWNFGPLPGDEMPVGRLVDSFVAAWGAGPLERHERRQQAARSPGSAAWNRKGALPTRLAAALERRRGRAADSRLVPAVLRRSAGDNAGGVFGRHCRLRKYPAHAVCGKR